MYSALKAIAYLFGGVLVMPGALLAIFFWKVTEITRQENFFKALFELFIQFLQSFELLFCVVLPGLIIWTTLAFFPSYRWIGALAMAMIAVVSLVEMIAAAGWPKVDDLFIPALSFLGLALNLWIVWDSGGGRQIWERWTK